MILVTGATGGAGGAVLKELLAKKAAPLRAMCRTEKDRASLPGDVEAVAGDFSDSASLEKALIGVTSALLVCGPMPELVALETNFLHAAKKAGLGHLVLFSALGAGDFGKSFPSWHRAVEDKAKELNLPVTIVRPNGFMQNISAYFAPTIRSQDAFYGTIGQAKISMIDLRDIAAAIARALTDRSTTGQVFELNGPEAVNYEELAGRISKVAGRGIKYVNLAPGQMQQALTSAGAPAWRVTALLELDEYYASGKGAGSDAVLRQLIGKPPRRLDDYLNGIAPEFNKA